MSKWGKLCFNKIFRNNNVLVIYPIPYNKSFVIVTSDNLALHNIQLYTNTSRAHKDSIFYLSPSIRYWHWENKIEWQIPKEQIVSHNNPVYSKMA